MSRKLLPYYKVNESYFSLLIYIYIFFSMKNKKIKNGKEKGISHSK